MSADAVVVGAGPNGLAAAVELARAGWRVELFEAESTIGGGARSAELTRPGFVHDLCSAVFPMGAVSPFFNSLPLGSFGLEWVQPPVMLAHPFDDGTAAVVRRSIAETAAGLGRDGAAYDAVVGSVVRAWPRLQDVVLGDGRLPAHPLAAARFGLSALQPAASIARRRFAGEAARALFGGVAAHGMLPLDARPSAAFGLVLAALAHVGGWPVPRGGAQRLSDALAGQLRAWGGSIVTGRRVRALAELPPARAILCDLSPRPFLEIAGDRLPHRYRRRLERYRYGVGSFKVDWALDGPIPWRADECRRAATVHLGGTLDDIMASERAVWQGQTAARPFVLLVQPTVIDPSRAPGGRHTAWAYCHVPAGSVEDMRPRIEAQVERYAPGFRARILGAAVAAPDDLERRNPNFVGGDIGSGVTDIPQLVNRATWLRHRTPVPGLYLCSAATAPGVSVHGMCGYFAARAALADAGVR